MTLLIKRLTNDQVDQRLKWAKRNVENDNFNASLHWLGQVETELNARITDRKGNK